ncbi:hypothetical protein MBLNU230_g1262t1 [Neophaeotheca triangularis]
MGDPFQQAPSTPYQPYDQGQDTKVHANAFHNQLHHTAQAQRRTPNYGQYNVNAFEMGAMGHALPPHAYSRMQQQQQQQQQRAMQYPVYDQQGPHSSAMYQVHAGSPYINQGPPPLPPMQYQNLAYDPQYDNPAVNQRQPAPPLQPQWQYGQPRQYAYPMNPAQISPMNVNFPPQANMGTYPAPLGINTDSGPVPSYPRGPPRKPKQSGFALWVGNIPPSATVTELKEHFSRDATRDIQSVFLIAKSNCAFVNYRSEAACAAAMNRFHDSRLNGTRLVCRLRRGSINSTTNTPPEPKAESNSTHKPDTTPTQNEPYSPTIVDGSSTTATENTKPRAPAEASASQSNPPKIPERFFIVKSLTMQDLEASVRKNIWATQPHNEAILNKAYKAADNVYLIFSANKSGEYFGYARMASSITGVERVDSIASPSGNKIPSASEAGTTPPSAPSMVQGPQSIPTPATATAPRGHIIDDSARGTIFWEASDPSHIDENASATPPTTTSNGESPNPSPSSNSNPDDASSSLATDSPSSSSGGRVFTVEWLNTTRLPFFRTRGLRNPWNANREVKIARDGTELEPSVGMRLVGMFGLLGLGAGGPLQSQQRLEQQQQWESNGNLDVNSGSLGARLGLGVDGVGVGVGVGKGSAGAGSPP